MKGWGLAFAIAVGVLLLCAVVFVLFFRGTQSDENERCRFNLMRVRNSLGAARGDSSREWDRQPTGRAFWAANRKWPGANIPIDAATLVCPVLGKTEAGRDVDYRGPASSYRLLKKDDPVCADRVGNHPDAGNVLLKSGEIVSADPGAWVRAAETTSD